MHDLAFYNVGCDDPRGLRRVVVLARRCVRRLLRPIFLRQVELFQHILETQAALADRCDQHEQAVQVLMQRIDHMDVQLQATLAFGWDYVALVRRLAILEDRVEALMAEREARESSAGTASPESCAKVA